MKNECNITINVDVNNTGTSLFEQIALGIEQNISAGILKPGDMLPSSRDLAKHLGVSRKTVVHATELLLLKGRLVSRNRVGLFIAPSQPLAHSGSSSCLAQSPVEGDMPAAITVNDGFPDTRLLPFLEFTRAYRKLFNRAAQWKTLGYNSPTGYHKFRRSIASMLRQSRSLAIEENEVCIVRGSQMALYLVAHSVLKRGDHVAIESPGYGNAYKAFAAAGLEVHPVEVDAEGINTQQLEQLCNTCSLKAVYLTPRHQYPTTVKLSTARRQHIQQLTLSHNLTVIEDDFGADFQFGGQHLLPLSSMLQKNNYIYIGTFSKIFAPAIRIGYVASSTDTIEQIANYRQLIDIQGDTVQEKALHEMLDSGVIGRHIKRSRKVYRQRLDHASEVIASMLGDNVRYHRPHGGLALWITLNCAASEQQVRAALQRYAVNVPLFTLSDGTIGLRIGYASMSNSEITDAVQAIAKALAHLQA